MKKIILIFLFCNLQFAISNLLAQAPNWAWAKGAGGTNEDWGQSVAVDASGNAYVTGYFDSPSITFGGTTLTNAGSSGLFYDVFIVKYNTNGNVVWAKSAGASYDDLGYSITVDGSGNSYVTGEFHGPSITFGGTTLTTVGGRDIFIVKYDSNGNVVWAKSVGGSSSDISQSIAVDASGNLYVTGHFLSPSITFGTTTLTNVGFVDAFVVKYNATGNVVWAKSAGGNSGDYGGCIAVDASGNLYVSGRYYSPSIIFGSITLTNAGSGTSDIFLVKYDASGNVVWARSAGGSNDDDGISIGVNGTGNSYVIGNFSSSAIAFGTTTLYNLGLADIFIAKYDSTGSAVWATSAGGNDNDGGIGIAVDGNENSYVTGFFASPSIAFGTTGFTNAGSNDMYVAKFDSSGNIVWATSTGEIGHDAGSSIAINGSGNAYVTGYFSSTTIDFGSTTLTTGGIYDIFVAKLDVTTGIEEIQSEEGFTVAPNPTIGEFRVSGYKFQIESIKIFNLLGQTVYQSAITTSQSEIEVDVSVLPKGLYFVEAAGDGHMMRGKFVKE